MSVVRIKDGSVSTVHVAREMWVAYGVALAVYTELNNRKNCVITSANDGKHKEGSLHYKGLALDLRVWNFSPPQIQTACAMLENYLGREYDVVNEGDHIHVEYDP